MAGSLKDRLTEILIKGNLLKKKDLDKALEIQKKSGGSLGKILVDQGFISQRDLVVAVSNQLDVPPIDLTKYKIDKELIKLIPEKVARQYLLLPLSKMGNSLTIVISDPLNVLAIDDLKLMTHFKIDLAIAPENEIKEAINSYYGVRAEMQEISLSLIHI